MPGKFINRSDIARERFSVMDTAKIISDLSNIKFRTNVKYFQLTTLGVGSAAAPLVADVEDDSTLSELLKYTFENNIKIFLLKLMKLKLLKWTQSVMKRLLKMM